jgi:hypothetical protein
LSAVIRNIQNEKTLAIRAVIEKWSGYFRGGKRGAIPKPERPQERPPVLHLPGPRKEQ